MIFLILAKSEPKETLIEHTENTLKVFKSIKETFPEVPELCNVPEFWENLFYALFFHDFGKAACGFQNSLETNSFWNYRHEILSASFLTCLDNAVSPDSKKAIAMAIITHHKDVLVLREKYHTISDEGLRIYSERLEELKPNFDELMKNSFEKIDKLFLDDDSKNLLKQIIEYIRKYYEKIETNYVSFNFTINTNNNEVIDTISNIMKDINNSFNYVNNNKMSEVSLYKLDNIDNLSSVYNDNGIVVIKDLKAIDMNDDNFKKKFVHELDINSTNRITIIGSNKEYIDLLFQYDEELRDKYFEINIDKPDINEVYNELLSKISGEIDDKMKIDLLDYISDTYEKSDLEYSKYIDNLYKDIVLRVYMNW